MTVYYADDRVTLHHGDALDILRTIPDASMDAVVTDPPYGLGFMGKEWDKAAALNSRPPSADETDARFAQKYPRTGKGPAAVAFDGREFQVWCELWTTECLRVLKPGGHLLAFGGSRTWHRLASAVEDAGFEIRDSIAWLYGSGFPKSLDVSKAIDKAGGDPLAFRRFARAYAAAVGASTMTHTDIDRHLGIKSSSCYWAREDHRGGMPPRWHWDRVRALLDLDSGLADLYDEAEREVIGQGFRVDRHEGHVNYGSGTPGGVYDITAPATPAAQQWQGWGTALKPAFEPIVVGRKPLAGTVAANVLAHGTGAINIDACRVATSDDLNGGAYAKAGGRSESASLHAGSGMNVPGATTGKDYVAPSGRWPANVVLDDTQAAALDQQTGVTTSQGGSRGAGGSRATYNNPIPAQPEITPGYGDTGGASRFFPTFRYQAKAPTRERVKSEDGTSHPTVKPLDLMRWLVRLVTPPDGTVLEPFAGSGTTVEACVLEGFRCVAIERESDYLPLIEARLARSQPTPTPDDDPEAVLF